MLHLDWHVALSSLGVKTRIACLYGHDTAWFVLAHPGSISPSLRAISLPCRSVSPSLYAVIISSLLFPPHTVQHGEDNVQCISAMVG